MTHRQTAAVVIAILCSSCSSSTTAATATPSVPSSVVVSTTPSSSDEFPDIIGVQVTSEGLDTWRFDVTISSPYDSPARYADAWRVLDTDGSELAIRVLTHDHGSEQPFTRSKGGITIPDGVTTVTVEGRDLSNGWGGGSLEVDLREVSGS